MAMGVDFLPPSLNKIGENSFINLAKGVNNGVGINRINRMAMFFNQNFAEFRRLEGRIHELQQEGAALHVARHIVNFLTIIVWWLGVYVDTERFLRQEKIKLAARYEGEVQGCRGEVEVLSQAAHERFAERRGFLTKSDKCFIDKMRKSFESLEIAPDFEHFEDEIARCRQCIHAITAKHMGSFGDALIVKLNEVIERMAASSVCERLGALQELFTEEQIKYLIAQLSEKEEPSFDSVFCDLIARRAAITGSIEESADKVDQAIEALNGKNNATALLLRRAFQGFNFVSRSTTEGEEALAVMQKLTDAFLKSEKSADAVVFERLKSALERAEPSAGDSRLRQIFTEHLNVTLHLLANCQKSGALLMLRDNDYVDIVNLLSQNLLDSLKTDKSEAGSAEGEIDEVDISLLQNRLDMLITDAFIREKSRMLDQKETTPVLSEEEKKEFKAAFEAFKYIGNQLTFSHLEEEGKDLWLKLWKEQSALVRYERGLELLKSRAGSNMKVVAALKSSTSSHMNCQITMCREKVITFFGKKIEAFRNSIIRPKIAEIDRKLERLRDIKSSSAILAKLILQKAKQQLESRLTRRFDTVTDLECDLDSIGHNADLRCLDSKLFERFCVISATMGNEEVDAKVESAAAEIIKKRFVNDDFKPDEGRLFTFAERLSDLLLKEDKDRFPLADVEIALTDEEFKQLVISINREVFSNAGGLPAFEEGFVRSAEAAMGNVRLALTAWVQGGEDIDLSKIASDSLKACLRELDNPNSINMEQLNELGRFLNAVLCYGDGETNLAIIKYTPLTKEGRAQKNRYELFLNAIRQRYDQAFERDMDAVLGIVRAPNVSPIDLLFFPKTWLLDAAGKPNGRMNELFNVWEHFRDDLTEIEKISQKTALQAASQPQPNTKVKQRKLKEKGVNDFTVNANNRLKDFSFAVSCALQTTREYWGDERNPNLLRQSFDEINFSRFAIVFCEAMKAYASLPEAVIYMDKSEKVAKSAAKNEAKSEVPKEFTNRQGKPVDLKTLYITTAQTPMRFPMLIEDIQKMITKIRRDSFLPLAERHHERPLFDMSLLIRSSELLCKLINTLQPWLLTAPGAMVARDKGKDKEKESDEYRQ